jgi:hypothetical protein
LECELLWLLITIMRSPLDAINFTVSCRFVVA